MRDSGSESDIRNTGINNRLEFANKLLSNKLTGVIDRLRGRSSSFNKDCSEKIMTDMEAEESESKQVSRYKPEGLDALCRRTKFTRKELQIMYRGFKNECPTGVVNEDTFKYIYGQFFPQGDCSAYAHYAFNTFDQDGSGTISFEEFVEGLSLLLRGSLSEKLQWTFSLYDINGDGVITTDELSLIVASVYDIMGKFTDPKIDEQSIIQHVKAVFQKMDADRDGVISVDEFINTCLKDDEIAKSMSAFDTFL